MSFLLVKKVTLLPIISQKLSSWICVLGVGGCGLVLCRRVHTHLWKVSTYTVGWAPEKPCWWTCSSISCKFDLPIQYFIGSSCRDVTQHSRWLEGELLWHYSDHFRLTFLFFTLECWCVLHDRPRNWRKKRIHFHDFMLNVHSRLQVRIYVCSCCCFFWTFNHVWHLNPVKF